MDPSVLYRRLEFATFSQREQIADEVVRGTPPEELGPLVHGLEHPHQAVRLGVIEILGRAGYRESLRKLLEHAHSHDGDDRVFAIRAMTQLAQPGDDFLAEAVKRWQTSGDPFVEAQANKLATILAPSRRKPADAPPPVSPPASAPRPERPEAARSGTLDKLVVELFAAASSAERLALVGAMEQRGPQAVFAVAKLVFQKGNADLVAYLCRAVIRQASVLPSPERLVPLLEAARRRLGDAPVSNAAIDDALLALGGLTLSPALLARIGEMHEPQVDALVRRLVERSPHEVALHVPAMLEAIARKPAMWASIGPALVHVASHVRESTRAELRRLTDLVVDDLRAAKPLPPITIVSACRVLAQIAERGEPLSRQLRVALERLPVPEAARALCALCARLATEDAAAVLIAMLRDPLPEARATARDALETWESPWISIEGGDEPVIGHRYQDEHGEPLVRRGARLVVASSGEDYVLDGRGRPIRGGETEWGGCVCCSPPRALIRRRGERLRCPASWESHLREGGRTMLERDHAGGGGDGPMPAPDRPVVPSERGHRDRDTDELPTPPTRAELEHVTPHIRAAILANVFLHARDGDQRWNGSGIIIARDRDHIAILTNRHVIESDDMERLCATKAMTVAGDVISVSAVWRARRGIDLAVVEGRVAHPENIGVMALGAGAVLVGAEVFTIGNPLGLAWSYSAGTLSAVRNWTTQAGQSVRILQTDANIAPGSSGGGLFHCDGHLLGVMSFLHQGHAGGSAHFALSVEAIRGAFGREGVRWRGQALAELP